MTKWTTLISALKQRNYKDALKELAAIQNYDDLQDALQVIPFKFLNQDLPASLVLLEQLYEKFILLTNDKEEGRLIIHHVFKADSLLKNFIQLEVEGVVIGGSEQNLECKDLIGHITQITWEMDKHLVDELTNHGASLKFALEHYQSNKTLISDHSFGVDDIKSNVQSCLTKYHSFIRHLDSLTKAGTRKYSEGKAYAVIYKDGYDSPRKGNTTRYNAGRRHNLSRSKSLVEDLNLHRGSVESVRKRLAFNKAVLNAIEPCKQDIEQGPRLLQNLRRLVKNDDKFLDVISELSPHITGPCFAHVKLEKVLGLFINSYDSLLSVVTSQKELSPTDQKSVEKDVESCVQKNDEVHAQTVEKTDTGLVNHGLKIDVTTSSPFRRRFNAKRPQRTHSCREPRSGEREGPVGTDDHGKQSGVLESKLQEKLAMKDKQLAETRTLVKNLKKREEQLLERLTAQAKDHLKRSEKFENISDDLPRTEQLIKQYDDLYSQLRLEAMDDLDNIESLNCLEKGDEIKSQISFAIMTVSFNLAEQELQSRRRQIFSLLGIEHEKLENGDFTSLRNEIFLQLRKSAAEINLKHVVDEVMDGLCSTMFDIPELKSCEELRHFAEACVRFSWTVSAHVPPLVISYDDTSFISSKHNKSHNSDKDCYSVRYHIWPTLLDSQTKAVLFKGIIAT